MSYRIGSDYVGSEELQTSTANMEIVPSPPLGWTHIYNFYKFSFHNEQATKVKINGNNTIYLRAGQGFSCEREDSPIYSFIVVDPNITFNWIGAY